VERCPCSPLVLALVFVDGEVAPRQRLFDDDHPS